MFSIGPIAFSAPWLLVALAALPILWLILRAVPPAPIRRRFPGVALLLGLQDDTVQSDRTPWWLLLLRMLAVAAIIAGFAGPLLNPQTARDGDGPLLIVADGTWADARDWEVRRELMTTLLGEAQRAGRPTAVVTLTNLPPELTFQTGEVTALALPALEPAAYQPDPELLTEWAETLDGSFDTFWLSDGLARESRDTLLASFENHGEVTVFQTPRQTIALRPAEFADGIITLSAVRTPTGPAREVEVGIVGLDPAGIERQLDRATFAFEAGAAEASVDVDLPPELRNRITRFELPGLRSAAAVTLTDDALRRREVALLAGGSDREGLELLSPTHYLSEALSPTADLIDGTVGDILLANPDVIVLADVAQIAEGEARGLQDWVEAGGLLVRFAGPRLAATDMGRAEEDPLMPVRLRAGGRTVGGAMSWGEPKALAPFDETSPFYGLPVPDDVEVTAQVMAHPDPSLADRVIAQLSDGTPLVTRKPLGDGYVVLFHVTANAEWSSLPLSGLYVQMLERLAISTRPTTPTAEDLEGTVWTPAAVLDAYGDLREVDTLAGVDGAVLADGLARAQPSVDMPPGLYAGDDRRIALNVTGADTTLAPAEWPARIAIEGMAAEREIDLKGWLLAGALGLLMIDILASLALAGRLRGARSGAVAVLALVLLTGFGWPTGAMAQEVVEPEVAEEEVAEVDDTFAIAATSSVVLAYVITGDAGIDEVSEAGLLGLSQTLFRRTSIEPDRPIGIDLERDELSLLPFIYWPITSDQPLPSADAYARLNRYLRTGGMILFDTRDADIAGFGTATPEGRRLQEIAAGLDIPPIAPLPQDHVLTRTFYLLQDFPGRWNSREVWVEAAPADAELAEGMPFRNLNDGVTPVVIGGNDWAAAWAVNDNGTWMLPVGRGTAGERQREIALRFGVNLIMHVLTGNYKSDQVHVPALLDRLGQ